MAATQRLEWHRNFIIIAILLSLAACKELDSTSDSRVEEKDAPILTRLPSISELAGTPKLEIPPLPALDAGEIRQGQQIYVENCAECHGIDLEGEANWEQPNEDESFRAPPHDATGHTWHHGDEALITSIEKGGDRLPANLSGLSKMPAFKDRLSEEEITAVLSYIKSSWPEEIRAIQWEQTLQERDQ